MLSVSVSYSVLYINDGRLLRSVADKNRGLLYGDLFTVCHVRGCWWNFVTAAVSEFVVMAPNMVIVCCTFIVFCRLMFLSIFYCMCVVSGTSAVL